jgi:hypothetical protein
MNIMSGAGTCRIPKLDPFHPHAMRLVEDRSDPLRCKTEPRANLSDGVLNITGKQNFKPFFQPQWFIQPQLSTPSTVSSARSE